VGILAIPAFFGFSLGFLVGEGVSLTWRGVQSFSGVHEGGTVCNEVYVFQGFAILSDRGAQFFALN